jgi:cytochrome c553
VVAALGILCSGLLTGWADPVIPGLVSGTLEPELRGQVLIEELNCVACHEGEGSLKARSKQAPRLLEVGSRLNPAFLERFIADPHGTQDGTTMPDVLSALEPSQRRATAQALTHFLLSLGKNEFSLQPPDAVAAEHGQRLFLSRGCVACHPPPESPTTGTLSRSSVALVGLESKYSFQSLSGFLREPHRIRPSGRMPDLRLSPRDVERITHYLLKRTRVPGALAYTLYQGQVWEGLASEEVRAERAGQVRDFALKSLGEVGHHTAIRYEGWMNIPAPGTYRFFLKMNGGSLTVDGRQLVQQDPSDHRGVLEWTPELELKAGWRAIQLTYFHTGHDPAFTFEMEGPGLPRKPLPESMLSASRDPISALEPFRVDPSLVLKGREAFTTYGCARCHDDLPVRSEPALPWPRLRAGHGCLGDRVGPWPRFDLNPTQRAEITQAMTRVGQPELSDTQRIQKTLVTLNCIACHERTGVGRVSPERLGFFTGTEPGLGDAGRLPPTLDQVGAKLTPEGFRDVLLHGKRPRRYLDASMPQYGEAQVGPLVDLFARVDRLEAAALPAVTEPQVFRGVGHTLVGSDGFSCIACHVFNGQKSGEMGAIDLATVSSRLQKNWFHLYLRDPARFNPTVIMPGYWPNGRSGRTDLLDGDASRQIEALWLYLAEGERAKKPIGLSRQSRELRVGDVTELCRGQSPVGYRGIAVGYPERIHLAFDSGEMALRLLWKGEFVGIDAGHFHPRGSDQISFPPGIPFHRLESPEALWPRKAKNNHLFPQDHGYQFLGYHLDAQRRPTFRYRYGDILVEDFFEDRLDPKSKPYFLRTLTFTSPSASQPFEFRAAAGEGLTAQSDRTFTVGPLQLRITSPHRGRVRQGHPDELLIPLRVPQGRSTLTLEYQW